MIDVQATIAANAALIAACKAERKLTAAAYNITQTK